MYIFKSSNVCFVIYFAYSKVNKLTKFNKIINESTNDFLTNPKVFFLNTRAFIYF